MKSSLTGKHFTLECELTDKIEDLKAKIEEKTGIPPDRQCLIFTGNGRCEKFEDGKTLLDHGVMSDGTVHLVLRIGTPYS